MSYGKFKSLFADVPLSESSKIGEASMAGCVSGFGLSHAVNVRNEAVLGKTWSQSSVFCNVRFKMLLKELSLGHVSMETKQRRLVVMSNNVSESSAEPQSGVATSVETKEGNVGSVGKDVKVLENNNEIITDSDGNGGNGKFNNGEGGGGGGGGSGNGNGDDSEQNDYEETEFGPIMKFEEVMKEVEARGASLPSDMFEAAKIVGIRKLLLLRYLDLQVLLGKFQQFELYAHFVIALIDVSALGVELAFGIFYEVMDYAAKQNVG